MQTKSPLEADRRLFLDETKEQGVTMENIYCGEALVMCGVRQGGVLSVISAKTGCYVGLVCVSVLLYADDILLLASSLSSLEKLLFVCEYELRQLDLAVNTKQ
jgi:hypothetical protein